MYDLDLPEEEQRFEDGREIENLAAPAVNGKCPQCNQRIGDRAAVCTKCGFDLAKGKMLKTKVLVEEGEDEGAEPRVSSETTSNWSVSDEAIDPKKVTATERKYLPSDLREGNDKKDAKQEQGQEKRKLSEDELRKLRERLDLRNTSQSSAKRLNEIDKNEMKRKIVFANTILPVVLIATAVFVIAAMEVLGNLTNNGGLTGYQLDRDGFWRAIWGTVKVLGYGVLLTPTMFGGMIVTSLARGVNIGDVKTAPLRLFSIVLSLLCIAVVVNVTCGYLIPPTWIYFLAVTVFIVEFTVMLIVTQLVCDRMFDFEGDVVAGTILLALGFLLPIGIVWTFVWLHQFV